METEERRKRYILNDDDLVLKCVQGSNSNNKQFFDRTCGFYSTSLNLLLSASRLFANLEGKTKCNYTVQDCAIIERVRVSDKIQ